MHAEESIQDVASRLESIIENAIDGIITIDADGVIETFNPAAGQLFQYEPEEVIGKNIRMLMPDPHRSHHDQYIRNYQDTGKARIIGIGREVYGLKKDGTQFPFRLSVSEIDLLDRKIYTGILHDMTEIKRAEDRLIQMNEELEEKVDERTREIERVVNRLLRTNKILEEKEHELQKSLTKERELNALKSRFVSMASHEFRTPLSTILSSAALVKMYQQADQQEKREKHIEKIQAAVTHLSGILNDFLSISKLEEGKVGPQISEVDPKVICVEVMDEMEGMLKTGQDFQFSSYLEWNTLYTDRTILKNIMFNLLSNAIKYSGEGDTIEVHIQTRGVNLEMIVRDHGIGIPVAEQKHMFDRFFRASNVESIQGTGLGLNIVYHYLQMIQGSIRFESKPGEGSTFFVTLSNLKT